MISSSVIGSAVLRMSRDRAVAEQRVAEVARGRSPLTQRQYCDGYEPSRPSCFAAAAFASGVAVASPPNMMSMMLPGSSRTIRKITIETATSVAAIEARRWARKRGTVRRGGGAARRARPRRQRSC